MPIYGALPSMNTDASQTTATCTECIFGVDRFLNDCVILCSRHAHVDALAAQNGALVEALRERALAYHKTHSYNKVTFRECPIATCAKAAPFLSGEAGERRG